MSERLRVSVSAREGGQRHGADRPKGTFAQTMRAVAWSFFGVRRRADHEQDVQRLNPVHVVVAGLVSAALFVAALVALVAWVTGSGVAG